MSHHANFDLHSSGSRQLLGITVVGGVVLFALGTAGYRSLDHGWVDSLYMSLQLFHLHFHAPTAEPHGAHPIPISLEVARFGAGLWALSLYSTLLALLFQPALRRWRVRRFWKDHVVVWGHCDRTLNLVLDLSHEGRHVVFIGKSPIPPARLPRKVAFLEGGDDIPALLWQAALARASRLVVLNESDYLNLEILVAAERACKERAANQAPLEVSAHFVDTHLQGGLYRSVVTAPVQQASRMRQHLFSYYDLVAGALARSLPLPPAMQGDKPLPEHFVIVGFGPFGQCVARKLVKMGLQLYRENGGFAVCKTRITVVDPNAEKAVRVFLQSNPQFGDYCELDALALGCEDPEFLGLEFLRGRAPARRTTLLLCLWDEAQALRAALLLRDLGRREKMPLELIGLRIAHPERLGSVFVQQQVAGQGPQVLLFAPDSEVFSADALLHRSLDVLARRVHEAYLEVERADRRANNLPLAAGKSWEDLSEDDRESNREAADHLWARLRALGYSLRPAKAGESNPESSPTLLDDLRQLEEDMARLEHERWMAWRVLNGWRWASERNNALKLHPDLVEYDKLAESTKEKDRIIIRAIPDLLKAGRLRVRKVLPHS